MFGHAFESIYFEMLGEQGWIGLGLFLGMLAWTLFGLRRLARRTRNIPHLAWCADMSDALQAGMVVFMTAGAFLDVAFQPELWYFIAMSVSLSEYVRRVEQQAAPAVMGTAAAASAAPGGALATPAGLGQTGTLSCLAPSGCPAVWFCWSSSRIVSSTGFDPGSFRNQSAGDARDALAQTKKLL